MRIDQLFTQCARAYRTRLALCGALITAVMFGVANPAPQAAEAELTPSFAKFLTCKPPITGIAKSENSRSARDKATYAWQVRVETRYGRSFVDISLTRGASWQCGREGRQVTCRVAAQPCHLIM